MSYLPESSPAPARPLPVAAVVLVSVVFSILILLARPWGILHGVGLILGAVTMFFGARAWRRGGRRDTTWALLGLSLQVGVFLFGVAGTAPLARFRLVQVVAILAAAAIVLWALLVRSGRFAPSRAAIIAAAAALGVLGVDRILGLGAPPNRIPPRRDWPDSSEAHPQLGRVPRPHVAFSTSYPDDRQGYLVEDDARARSWVLQVMPGSIAELVRSPSRPELLRVAIQKANPDTTWHVQLLQSRFEVRARTPYFITFRARADRPRKIAVTFSQNHPPWVSLGLYQPLDLTPEWKEFREVFVSRQTDTNTIVLFHLAGSSIPVEFDSVTLHGPPSGRRIAPIVPGGRFFIRSQRNALGCRDREYPVPRPANRVRILALGDAFTTGVGVYDKDTFAKQLEGALNGSAPESTQSPGYEVINCGVSGYGTHEQRLFFELFTASYRPDIVLVTMAWNDDRLYWERGRRELFRAGPGRLAQLSSILRKAETSSRLRRRYDYQRSVEDLLALDQAVRARGGRLIVAVSRHGPPGLADAMLRSVSAGLAASRIPLLDLGPAAPGDSVPGDPREPPGPQAHRTAALKLLRWIREDVLPELPPGPRVP